MGDLTSELIQGLRLACGVADRLHKNKVIGKDELDSVHSIANKLIPKIKAALIVEAKTTTKRYEAEQFVLPLENDN